MITVTEVAARWNLKPQHSKDEIEWIGPNPIEAGAEDDGFALFSRGNGFDRKLQRPYSALEVAKAAGIDYQEYEGSLSHPKRDVDPIEISKFDDRTLEERGLSKKAARFWQVSGPLGRDSSWGEYRKFPTHSPDGNLGRSRTKFRSPQLQLIGNNTRKPAKTMWDTKTEDLPQPLVYGADKIEEGEVVWLVNSELAVWLFWQEGVRAVCTFGESIGDKTLALIAKTIADKKPAEINIILDNDAAGRACSVRAFAAFHKHDLLGDVVDFSGMDYKDGYDAADLWEYFNEVLRDTGIKFSEVLADQPIASKKTLRTWKELSERPIKAAAKEKAYKTLHEVAEKADRLGSEQKTGVASELIGILRANALFRTDDNDWCIVVDKNGRNVTYSLQSADFRRWLNYRYLGDGNQVLKKDEVEQICKALIAIANEEGKLIKAFYRSGYIDKTRIFVDLADDTGRVVEIDAGGWRVKENHDVFFRKSDVILPLPEPVHTPEADKAAVWNRYRALVNHKDDHDWSLMLAWLVSALVPAWWACPILMLSGQAGSGKSSVTEFLRNMIDPNKAFMVTNTDQAKDLVVNAEKGRCFCMDNQSKMPLWLSDLLSSLITGAPYSVRSLYTNDEQRVFNVQRAMILTGIPDNMGQADLIDRAIKISLPVIENKQTGAGAGVTRKRLTLLKDTFDELQPAILGLIFDAMSAGLRNWPNQDELLADYEDMPRMADFFAWVMCCEEALPVPRGTFYHAYVENIHDSAESTLENDFAKCLRAVLLKQMPKPGRSFEMLVGDLHEAVLEAGIHNEIKHDELAMIMASNAPEHEKARAQTNYRLKAESTIERRKDWPTTVIAFGVAMTRLLPSLQKADGITMMKKRVPEGTLWMGMRHALNQAEESEKVPQELFQSGA